MIAPPAKKFGMSSYCRLRPDSRGAFQFARRSGPEAGSVRSGLTFNHQFEVVNERNTWATSPKREGHRTSLHSRRRTELKGQLHHDELRLLPNEVGPATVGREGTGQVEGTQTNECCY